MKRALVSVEGQTEETFVREVLSPHLLPLGLWLDPILVATARVKHGPVFKGGLVTYHTVKKEIRRLFLDRDAIAITTMYDLYGLPDDFPGYATRPAADSYAKVRHLEAALQADLAERRFYPYLQLHEFEALLFADPDRTAAQFPGRNRAAELWDIRREFRSPEEINDDPATAPSRRLRRLYPTYQKPFHGVLAVVEAGLEPVRRECPHFNAWLAWLESLAATPPTPAAAG